MHFGLDVAVVLNVGLDDILLQDGMTALHVAVHKGRLDIVDCLLSHGQVNVHRTTKVNIFILSLYTPFPTFLKECLRLMNVAELCPWVCSNPHGG